MWLARSALRNPYSVVVLGLAIIVLGATVVGRIPTDILPQFRTPAVQVVTFYPGMPAETVERDISTRMQRWTGQSVGIEHQEAKSMLGVSIVKDFFREDIDPNSAMSQVTSYAMSDLYYLPPGTVPPMVMPFDPTASLPLCLFSVSSPIYNETELYDIAYFEGRNRLQSISGVIAPAVYGGKLRRILAYLDRSKLQSRSLSPMDVVNSIHRNNVFIPTGSARFGEIEYQIESNAMVAEPEDINDFPVKLEGGASVFVKDIGIAEDTSELQSNIVRVDGKRQLYIPIYRQPGANTIRVVDGVRSAIPELEARLPEGVDMDVVFDQSVFVRDAIRQLAQEGILGALLAALMILIFLRSFRSTAFILLTLPLSLLAALIGLYFTDNTINAMTLGGLAIAVGLLIDQSIVVLENIERHLGMGETPMESALNGAAEVAKPMLVIVVTICVALLPVIFLSGIGRFLFTPLAVSVTIALAASYVLALTIVPACGARFLVARARHGAAWFDAVQRAYSRGLERVLAARTAVILGVVALFVGSLLLYCGIGQELFPQVDSGQFTIRVRAPSGTKVDETEKTLVRVENAIREVVPKEQLRSLITNIGVLLDWPAAYTPNSGPHDAFVLVQTTGVTPDRVLMRSLRKHLTDHFPGIEFSIEPNSLIRSAITFGLPAPINVQVRGNDLHRSMAIAEEVKRRIRSVPGTVDVRIQQRLDYPQFELTIDRQKCASLGLSQDDVVKNIVTAFNSSVSFAKSFWIDERNGNHYWIGAQYPEPAFEDLETLLNVPITSAQQYDPVLLRNVVQIERATAPSEVMHHNISRVIDVYADVDGRDIGGVAADIEMELRAIERESGPDGKPRVPKGYAILRRGEVQSMMESFRSLAFGLILATVLVYLVMVVQFRSLRDPLVVMVAVPLGLIGVLWMLYLTGTAISIPSLMGVIMMVGVVVSFSVLIIDFANRMLATGISRLQAVREACKIRLRPILMVSLAAVLGLVPMAIAGGANTPLARAVIGGVLAATVLTLFVVPVLFMFLGRGADKEVAS
ncbi:MAG: efflux RND transporter permease subunit [Planctomycetes bacterium]|nr:efflux RND transporter permease subunit [Planctomycetota bacterium]